MDARNMISDDIMAILSWNIFIFFTKTCFGARDLFDLLDFEQKLTLPHVLDLKQRQKVIIFDTFSGRVGGPEKYF